AVMVKFEPAFTLVPAPVPLLFAEEVTVKAVGRMLKLSVSHAVLPPPTICSRASLSAWLWLMLLSVTRPPAGIFSAACWQPPAPPARQRTTVQLARHPV